MRIQSWTRLATSMAAFGLMGCNEIIGAVEGIPREIGEDAPVACAKVEQCVVEMPDCRAAVECKDGTCVFSDAIEGTPVSEQVEGDCAALVCNGQGSTKLTPNPDDVEDDGNPCTIDACDGAKVTHVSAAQVPCYSGPKGTLDKGICHAGTQHCDTQGNPVGGCEGEQLPQEESCISCIDDDCDGQANEEGEACVCVPGTVEDCYTGPEGTEGVGLCHSGKWSCTDCGLGYGGCLGEVTPISETCDAAEADQDCDGNVNEEGGGCVCGDGYLSAGEECDDGNLDGTDACTSVCTVAKCGDGFMLVGAEECDDGNLVTTDACTSDCLVAKCGDEIVQMGAEECDDGANEDGDACSATCLEEKVLQLALGGSHSCGLLHDGLMKCWGGNYSGQLGLGDSASRGDQLDEMGGALPPVDFGSGKVALAIAAGGEHTCAVIEDGTVKCWGGNYYCQLGLAGGASRGDQPSEMGNNLPAVDLGAGQTAVSVGAGRYHTCALLDDGTLKCWGSNGSSQLGFGFWGAPCGTGLPAVDLGSGKTAVAVALGEAHTCALLNDNTVKCWGNNGYGQLGRGDASSSIGFYPWDMGDALPTISLGSGKTAMGIATGWYHTCALLNDGTVKCWGYNGYGQLGLGNTTSRGTQASDMGDGLLAVNLGNGKTAVAIAAGYGHTCALLNDSTVKCWGANDYGQLGVGDTLNRGDESGEMGDDLPAIDLGNGSGAVAIQAGGGHTCATLDTGAVKCWGGNYQGQLGLGNTSNLYSPGDTTKLYSNVW